MIKQTKQPKFEWDETTGLATCTLTTDYGTFVGVARCHPDDKDMVSEKVGCEIAYSRAAVKSFTHERDYIIKPSLKALKQLYYSMKHSKKFNSKSYEAKMIWSQIHNWQYDLNTINSMIDLERKITRDYINTKEILYQNLRK